jgi:hypothetical protein
MKGFFNGGCHDRVRQFMSVWYSYAADTLTNIMSTPKSLLRVTSSILTNYYSLSHRISYAPNMESPVAARTKDRVGHDLRPLPSTRS